ncbi:hypothetical protein H181DRAFT_03134 [Streptomyces sp. WMMB 714]|uniref:hypothetical protein n=1 Tax=Streptomyces sp. WMMB 714 TaxID=1286822 RepID=UPI000698898D|nr:hypothetical protein H181DRAFT_03134 [Streptomyces sp. WMMB 714]
MFIISWADAHPLPAAVGVVAAVAVLALVVRAFRALPYPAPAVAAAVCTAYSADTAWRFAGHHLGMVDTAERAALFAAGEIALLATALMARHNVLATGSPGVPGLLVWAITGVQIIPAFAESGAVGGTVRAFFGPVLAALLWHLAMGLEIRHKRPGAVSGALLAVVGRELRERLLSRLGLAQRGRDAAQLTRDRATATAVRLASRPNLRGWGKRRLASAVARAKVGTDENQKAELLALLRARRGAALLSSVDVGDPWAAPAPAHVPALPEYTEYTPSAAGYTVPFAAFPPPPEDDDGPDPLTEKVRAEYADLIDAGGRPSIRQIRAFGVGQPRAERIQAELEPTAEVIPWSR